MFFFSDEASGHAFSIFPILFSFLVSLSPYLSAAMPDDDSSSSSSFSDSSSDGSPSDRDWDDWGEGEAVAASAADAAASSDVDADADADAEETATTSLFDSSTILPSASAALEHDAKEHGFDLLEFRKKVKRVRRRSERVY